MTPVRPARPEDVPDILRMVHELAEYERAAHEVVATQESLSAALFGGTPDAPSTATKSSTDTISPVVTSTIVGRCPA